MHAPTILLLTVLSMLSLYVLYYQYVSNELFAPMTASPSDTRQEPHAPKSAALVNANTSTVNTTPDTYENNHNTDTLTTATYKHTNPTGKHSSTNTPINYKKHTSSTHTPKKHPAVTTTTKTVSHTHPVTPATKKGESL